MSKANSLWIELKQEAANTKKLLELVPEAHFDFKPHEKSMTLKRLATHVAEINGWWKECLVQDELDFSKDSGQRKTYATTADIVQWHDELVAKAELILRNTTDEDLDKPWTMRNGDQIYFTAPKKAVVRTWCLNHLFHHRGQLTVYLRLLNIALPEMYGPTADTEAMMK